jgi:hypothetical protein
LQRNFFYYSRAFQFCPSHLSGKQRVPPYVRLSIYSKDGILASAKDQNELSDGKVGNLPEIERNAQFVLRVILLTAALAASVCAYDYPLSSTAIRQAYFFGRSTDRAKVAEFLAQYEHRFHPQQGGPGVGLIELRTPYEEVVRRSSENQTTGYSAQQAQIDYAAQPDLIKVQVFLFFGAGQGGSPDLYSDSKGRVLDRRENFWREFRFRVMQEHLIEPRRIEGKPMYSRRGKGLSGAEVNLEFDAGQFAPRETRVEVITPDGQTVVAEFALDQLK